ncbi:centrosome and spindle pole-associated protein 1-like isoform X2 [Poeciliopsis prolifica]|uniref:centrosome and spindle pole-associated protein 1-like isoform X2 n=1 Tax=Poeciliopsis prolifica TaxID=188132 RepID=UPI002413068A|nr:centrosome and spindle pole-associated protein 1-like isoform X2 [Poeciliopsis prolifica]
MPPSASAAQEITHNLDTDSGIAALGRDYEKKKKKLLLELQLEYKDYAAKKKVCKSHVHEEQQALSLPIEEKVSVKERLREERQREYNLFLQEQVQNGRAKKGAHPVTSKPEHQASDAVSISSPGSAPSFISIQTSTPPHQRESPRSVKNAATLTEAGDYRRSPDIRRPCSWRRRRWEIHQPGKTYSSEEELNTEEEEECDLIRRRRRRRSTNEQVCKEEWGTPDHGQRRDLRDIKEMEALAIRDQNSSNRILTADISQTPQNLKTTAKSTPTANKVEKQLATGLMIGAVEEQSVIQMKKELYKQELLRQMAEQQKNKKREKKCVLKFGAAEATTPEKEIGAASHQHQSLEQDVPKCDNLFESSQPRTLGHNPLMNFSPNFNQLPGNTLPLCGMGAVQVVPPFNYYNTFPGMPGQVAVPWVPVVPPGSQIVSNGDASRFEGPRKQDRYSNQYLNWMFGGAQQKETCETSQRSESTESYREAPRPQVAEKEGCTKREKEKKRREAAQLEGELVVYDPWGKGGGGAPIRDKHGNLVSDLYQMRSFNNKRMTSVGAELESPISLQESSHPSPLQQDRYTEELRQQIEERKRKKAEERERVRIAEENEEKKLAMERLRIQQQYEEEKRREKEMRSKGKQSNHAETRDIEKVLSKEQKNLNAPKRVRQNERRESPSIPTSHRRRTNAVTSPSSAVGPLTPRTVFLQREPSPPVPTLQRKQTSLSPSPSSDMSSPASRIERIVSAPSIQPVTERKPSIPGQQEVIRELSTLRKFLRREQKQLELQLREEAHNPHLHKH